MFAVRNSSTLPFPRILPPAQAPFPFWEEGVEAIILLIHSFQEGVEEEVQTRSLFYLHPDIL